MTLIGVTVSSQLDYEPRGKESPRTAQWEWLVIALGGALLLAWFAYVVNDLLTIRVAG